MSRLLTIGAHAFAWLYIAFVISTLLLLPMSTPLMLLIAMCGGAGMLISFRIIVSPLRGRLVVWEWVNTQ